MEDLQEQMRLSTVYARTKMNWSDVAPWMYEATQEPEYDVQLNGIRQYDLRADSGRQIKTINDVHFNPYPYSRGDSNDAERRRTEMAKREAQEIDAHHMYVRSEDTIATLLGGARHHALESYWKHWLKNESIDPAEEL